MGEFGLGLLVNAVWSVLGRNVEIKTRSSADIDQLARESFISLGGPKANGISEKVLSRLGNRLPVRYDSGAECFNSGGSAFKVVYDDAGFVTRDYGLVIRLLRLDPNGPESKPVLVVFGLHGHGTEHAVKAIIDNFDLSNKLELFLSKDLFAFLMFEFVDHKWIRTEILRVDAIA